VSVEVVTGPDGQLFVIDGSPGGYQIRRVGPAFTTYVRKFEARRDVRAGRILVDDEPIDLSDES